MGLVAAGAGEAVLLAWPDQAGQVIRIRPLRREWLCCQTAVVQRDAVSDHRGGVLHHLGSLTVVFFSPWQPVLDRVLDYVSRLGLIGILFVAGLTSSKHLPPGKDRYPKGVPVRDLDRLDRLFVLWAFFFQIVLMIHFALRKRLFESYTLRFGWLVYALSIPALVISVILWAGGKSWSFWLGGFLFLIYAAFGCTIDYVTGIEWRQPLRVPILVPYVLLYLATVMF